MTKIAESHIEEMAINLLESEGFQYLNGKSIAPGSDNPMRLSSEDVLLVDKLKAAIKRLNPTISQECLEDAYLQLKRLQSPQLITNNETFHSFLTEGVNVTWNDGNTERGDYVRLIDFEDPENNDFCVVNQLTIVENQNRKRPDIVLFINGLPLVVIELKNPSDANATIFSAFKQLQTYKQVIPSLFIYNSIVVVSDGLDAKAGTISSEFNRFMAWKSIDGIALSKVSQLETLIKGMLTPKTLLDLIQNFIVFTHTKKEDPKTGITTIETKKLLAAYHQYYAVNKSLESVISASMEGGDRKGGIIWHTQGSGKSLTMVFATGKIVRSLHNPTVVVITDRNDLDDQLFDTFAGAKQLLRQEPLQAVDRKQLKDLLKVASGGVVFTTIQKFQPEEGQVFECLSLRNNIVVIADEAHRTQYGFKAKTVSEKDTTGQVVGVKTVYGFAKYMRDALPNATYLGFTGTPIEGTDVNTPAVFGNYVDIYDIERAVEDGATVRIYYESRLVHVGLEAEGRRLIKEFEEEIMEGGEELSSQKAKKLATSLESVIGSSRRLQSVAQDIVSHFSLRCATLEGKGMIVTMSRRIAVALYEEIIKLKPEWHSEDLTKGAIKVVMTSTSSDPPSFARHHSTKEQRRILSDRLKNPGSELKLVIVCDMWLTGFDVPCLHTLYIDKPMKGHALMQAIARVNRVYKDKLGGLIVDYLGIASELKKALSFYSEGKQEARVDQETAVNLMLNKLEVVLQMFSGFAYKSYFEAETAQKLNLILDAEEHILGLENGKKWFMDEVTALSRVFAIAIPHPQAMAVKDEIAFFEAVKTRLAKFDTGGLGESDDFWETATRRVISEALVSYQVVDIFDAAGIKKPDISILSEDFLQEIKNMKRPNLAVETLQKLLSDEIKSRSGRNLVESANLMSMLEDSLKRYHSKVITAAEIIEELIQLAKDMSEMDQMAQNLGLSEYEYAFYAAVADNESVRELMSKTQLRELAIVLAARIKENTSIDWTIKESVRAQLKVIVKRTLRQYGYPPDMQLLATETVLKQAELMAG